MDTEQEHQKLDHNNASLPNIIHQQAKALTQKDAEIQMLMAEIAALTEPKPLTQRVKSLLIKIYWTLREHPRLQWLKRIYKRLRHLSRMQISEMESHPKVIFDPPITPGHPGVSPDRRVTILTYTFFDFDGNNMYYGGAERYLLELAGIIRKMGFMPEVVQCGNGYWVRYYQDLRVTGIDVGGDAARLVAQFAKLDHQEALIIHSPFSLASFQDSTPAIGIGHGIHWDHPSSQADPNATQKVLETIKNL
ncbi:MAG: glycosyltransferase, partial [Chloroflexota bacterium]